MTQQDVYTLLEPPQARTLRVEAVVQSRVSEDDPWRDEGTMRALSSGDFEKAARKYLNLYRMNHRHMDSRLIKRFHIVLDEVVEG